MSLNVVEENEKKSTIVIRSIITEYKTYEPVLTQYEILGNLYAAKAKKMTNLPTGASISNGNALASGKSVIAYNISDIIEKVKNVFPDTFSNTF